MPVRFRCARRPQCPVHDLSIVVSRQTVAWVCGRVVVSSGPSPLTSLTVSEQGFGFVVSGGGQGLKLFAPRLGQAICSFIPWIPTVGWDSL